MSRQTGIALVTALIVLEPCLMVIGIVLVNLAVDAWFAWRERGRKKGEGKGREK